MDTEKAVFEWNGTNWVQRTSWVPATIAHQLEREMAHGNPGRQFTAMTKDEARARGIYVP